MRSDYYILIFPAVATILMLVGYIMDSKFTGLYLPWRRACYAIATLMLLLFVLMKAHIIPSL